MIGNMSSSRGIKKRLNAFSFAESLISMVIVGTLTVAALNAVGSATTGRSQVSRQAIAHSLGQALLSEIMALPYEDPNQTPKFGLEGSESGNSRLDFDDVDDYVGWANKPLQSKDGVLRQDMPNWSRDISVDWVLSNNLAFIASNPSDIKRITVSVQYKLVEMAKFVGIRTPGPPTSSSIPKILFLLTGTTVPTAIETTRISLMESWGYHVVTLAATSNQTVVDTNLADISVVYISSEVNPATMTADFTATTKGVVNENSSMLSTFGFDPNVDLTTQPDIRLDVITHYITSIFTAGWRNIFTTPQPVATLTPTLTLGVTPLGSTRVTGMTTHMSLGCLDTGALQWNGVITPGRRVMLPWGQPTFDFNALNADGQKVMLRSIAWAAGLDTP